MAQIKLFFLILATCLLHIFIAVNYQNLFQTNPSRHSYPSHLNSNSVWISSGQLSHNLSHSDTVRPRKPCSPLPHSGIVYVPLTASHINGSIRQRYQKPNLGGVWTPSRCRPVQKVAILVPYRNRSENLLLFSHHMHYFLQQQQLEYGIFVVEQMDNKIFNRAKLFNIGFLVSQKLHEYDCYILHDIDKLPEDTRFLYHCNAEQPKQMPHMFHDSTLDLSQAKKRRIGARYFSAHYYKGFFGGVSALTKHQFESINGMTNNYWGWGAEDDELYCRITSRGYKPIFTQDNTAKFVILNHHSDMQKSGRPMPNCAKVANYMDKDGVNSVQYELFGVELRPLYTTIKAYL